MSYSRKTPAKTSLPSLESIGSERARVYPLIILCISAVVCLTLLLFITLPTTRLAWSSVQNVGHFFLFAALAVIYSAQVEKMLHWNFLPKATLIVIVLTFIGALAELLQLYLPARNASIDDMWRNLAGILTGLICYASYRYRTKLHPALLIINLLAAVSISLWVSKPTIKLVGYIALKSPLPAVLHFNDPFIDSMISTTGGAVTTLENLKPDTGNTAEQSLRMDFAKQLYSGVIFHEPGSQWTQYTNLALHIFNPNKETVDLAIRIHDAQHDNNYEDRFNTTFNISPGLNELLIPIEKILSLGGNSKKRLMDMQNIKELQLFSNSKKSFTLYVKGIELTRQS